MKLIEQILKIPISQKDLLSLLNKSNIEFDLKLGIFEKILFKILGYIKIGTISNKIYRNISVYIFNCPYHGYQISIPTGWHNKLICPHCIATSARDLLKKFNSTITSE